MLYKGRRAPGNTAAELMLLTHLCCNVVDSPVLYRTYIWFKMSPQRFVRAAKRLILFFVMRRFSCLLVLSRRCLSFGHLHLHALYFELCPRLLFSCADLRLILLSGNTSLLFGNAKSGPHFQLAYFYLARFYR